MRGELLDLPAEALDVGLAGLRPVSVTVTAGPGQPPRLTLLAEAGPASAVVRVGLDENGLRALLGEGWGVVDLAV